LWLNLAAPHKPNNGDSAVSFAKHLVAFLFLGLSACSTLPVSQVLVDMNCTKDNPCNVIVTPDSELMVQGYNGGTKYLPTENPDNVTSAVTDSVYKCNLGCRIWIEKDPKGVSATMIESNDRSIVASL